MPYADTDFFLAILKDSDWLKTRAGKAYAKHKGTIWTSFATIIELMLLAKKFEMDAEKLVASISGIAEMKGIDPNIVFLAAHYLKHYKINVFDAFHAAFCDDDFILSSDEVFDELGLKRIKL